MMNTKTFLSLAIALMMVVTAYAKQGKADNMVVVAYVTSWTNEVPDPTVMTHINYAFGHVSDSFDAVRIDNPDRLRMIVGLKQQKPSLKVMLSVGGWGSGRFSEMASSEQNRKAFAKDCRRKVDEFGLDGIDIDWEYPTQSSAGISASPNDTQNFTLLMRDLRRELGKKKLLTAATVCDAKYIDFQSCIQYMDFVNVMAYDMGNPPHHHAALYPSAISSHITSSQAVEEHLKAGVPASKLVMGMPFYGRGARDDRGMKSDGTIPARCPISPTTRADWSEDTRMYTLWLQNANSSLTIISGAACIGIMPVTTAKAMSGARYACRFSKTRKPHCPHARYWYWQREVDCMSHSRQLACNGLRTTRRNSTCNSSF